MYQIFGCDSWLTASGRIIELSGYSVCESNVYILIEALFAYVFICGYTKRRWIKEENLRRRITRSYVRAGHRWPCAAHWAGHGRRLISPWESMYLRSCVMAWIQYRSTRHRTVTTSSEYLSLKIQSPLMAINVKSQSKHFVPLWIQWSLRTMIKVSVWIGKIGLSKGACMVYRVKGLVYHHAKSDSSKAIFWWIPYIKPNISTSADMITSESVLIQCKNIP